MGAWFPNDFIVRVIIRESGRQLNFKNKITLLHSLTGCI